jgi:CHAD domain-containing protein
MMRSAKREVLAMVYSLDPAKSVSESVRSIALAEIDNARACLSRSADFHIGVHNARKSLKRLRSLLELIQPGIPETLFLHLKADLSKTAKQLAPARDAQALADTVDKLGKNAPKLAHTGTVQGLSKWLNDRCSEAETRAHADPATKAVAALDAARSGFANLALNPDDFSPLAEGIRTTYRAARKAYRKAFAEQTDEAIHEWRKVVQRHWRQMQLLSACWPEELGPRADHLHHLAQLLGDDHDLANLRNLLATPIMTFGNQKDTDALEKRCRKNQKALRIEAQQLGSRLFAEKPKAFTERIVAHWQETAKAAAKKTPGKSGKGSKPDGGSNVLPFGARDGDLKLG